MSRLDLPCVLCSRCMCPRGGGLQTQALGEPSCSVCCGFCSPSPSSCPCPPPSPHPRCCWGLAADHACLSHHHGSREFPTATSPHDSEATLWRSVLYFQNNILCASLTPRQTRTRGEHSGIPDQLWRPCPEPSPRFQVEPSGPVFSKRELIIEKRKSIELGGSPASGHRALSWERTALAFERTKSV